MAKSSIGAGDLRHRVAFDKRAASSGPDYGNPAGPFAEQFSCRAAFRHRGGSEAVMSARLQGRRVLDVFVRSSQQSRQIEPNWQMRDVRTGGVYAVKVVDSVTDRRWVYLLVESGTAP